MDQNLTHRNHYIPRFYLKNWSLDGKTIRKEKEQLIKEGKIKKEKNPSYIFRGADNLPYEKVGKNEPVCIADEVPFDIPETWEWARLGMISTYSHTKQKINAQNADPKMWVLDLEDIEKGGRLLEQKTVEERKAVGDKTFFDSGDIVLWDTVPYCEIAESDIGTYLLQTNDILFARTGGTVGKSYLVQEVPEEAIYAGYLIRTRYSQWLCPQYLKFFMESELYWSQLRNGTIATAQPNCNGKTLGKMLLPIPPLSEQYRIVEKVNALFDYCNSI